jgi:hypothetical protein
MARVAWPLGRGGAGRCLRLWEWNGMEWSGVGHAMPCKSCMQRHGFSGGPRVVTAKIFQPPQEHEIFSPV